jgi:S1-C subfamily serine protease
MRLTTKILVGIMGILLTINSIWVVYDVRNSIQTNQELINRQILELRSEINNSKEFNLFMFKLIDINENIILQTQKSLNKRIDTLPDKIKYDKFMLEKKLQSVNVVIHNETVGSLGSGVTLKYKDKFYILTAGHMLNRDTDKLTFSQNGENFGELEIIKWIFDPTDETLKGVDLLLSQPKNKDLIPKIYIELADYEPLIATEVYVVGNPMGIENVISDGRIIAYEENYMIFIDHSYFGNSGGGVYTKEGKLIGINSIISDLKNKSGSEISYVIGGTMRLDVIKSFLEGVE